MRHCVLTLFQIFLFLTFLFFPTPVLASDQPFSVSYDISYQVQPSSLTSVTQKITLVNNTSFAFPSTFLIRFRDKSLTNLRAVDDGGIVATNIELRSDGTIVKFKLNNPAPGLNSSWTWLVTYDTATVARKVGRLWQIAIPPPPETEGLKDFSISLVVPESFGSRILAKPEPIGNPANWMATNHLGSGIELVYSSDPYPYQAYDFRLNYFLQNNSLFPTDRIVMLPPDTAYQKIFLDNLDPRPNSLTIDADGNWLANYRLLPLQSIRAIARGTAAVLDQPLLLNKSTAPFDQYLRPSRYWNTLDPGIKNMADHLHSPLEIYNFVSEGLTYDRLRVGSSLGRVGGSAALKNPTSAVCLEFTDLFVTLARAAGIPAREIEGYAASTDPITQPLSLNGATLHSWPEYFDVAAHSWHMVDPTWANTTRGLDYFDRLDFNHLTLAIHGQSSSLPQLLPDTSTETSFNISPSNRSLDLSEAPQVSLSVSPDSIIALLPQTVKITIKNNSRVRLPAAEAIVSSSQLGLNQAVGLPAILPYSSHSFDLNVRSESLKDSDAIISLQTAQTAAKTQIKLVPPQKSPLIIALGIVLTYAALSAIAKTAGSLSLQKRPR